jgi:hypothetical protein
MRILEKTKDGGPDSTVDAYFLCEFKGLFSIALLKFNKGGRENYHTHAFNAWTWFLKGFLIEHVYLNGYNGYYRSWKPKITKKSRNHRVYAVEESWALTVRGPWSETWTETSLTGEKIKLAHGRLKV